MSAETSEWLNRNVLIGYTSKRGVAWHYRRSDQGVQPNHYAGPIPIQDVQKRLFHWTPQECAVQAVVGDAPDLFGPVTVPADDHKAIFRPDTGAVLGIVGKNYTVHDYPTWLLDNVSKLVGEAGIGSAGLLEGGARAWVQVEVPETCETPEGVAFRPFLTAASSVDGSMATSYLTGAQVVVCDNTLRAAMQEKAAAKLRIRHSSRSLLRVDDARQALDLLDVTREAFLAQVKEQCQVRVSNETWTVFVKAHFPLRNEAANPRHAQMERRRALSHLWNEDERVAPWRNTAYGVVAAVNTYQHHVASGGPTRSRPERNAHQALMGKFDGLDRRTLRTLQGVLPK